MTRPNVAHSRLQTVDEIVLESLSRLIFYISLCAFSTATGGCAPQAWLSDANDLMGRQELSEALIRYEDILMMRSSHQVIREAERVSISLIERLGSAERDALSSETLSRGERCLTAFRLELLQPHADDHLNYSEVTRREIHMLWLSGAHFEALRHFKDMLNCAAYQGDLRHELAWFTDLLTEELITKVQRHVQERPRELAQLIALDEVARRLLDLYMSHPLTMSERLRVDVVRSQLYEMWRASWIGMAQAHHEATRWGGEWVALSLALHAPSCTLRPQTCMTPHFISRDLELSDQLNEARAQTRARAQALIRTQIQIDVASTTRAIRDAIIDSRVRGADAQHDSMRDTLDALLSPASAQRLDPKSAHKPERWTIKEERDQCSVTRKEIKGEVRYLDHHREAPSTRHKLALKAVESQQELLEKTQAQREELERSLAQAHQRLQTLMRSGEALTVKLSQAQRSLEQLRTHKQTVSDDRSALVGQATAGPPTDVEVKRASELKLKLGTLSQEVKALSIKVEIEAEARREHQGKTEREREEVTRLSQYLAKITKEEAEQSAKLEALEIEFKALPAVKREPVYSVFRYPITEYAVNCNLTWEGLLSESPSESASHTSQSSWRSGANMRIKVTQNKAFPRYGVTRVRPHLKRVEERAISQLRQTLASRLTRWFETRGESRLIKAATQKLSVSQSQPISSLNADHLELLALLTHLDADTFAISLSRALTPELGHRLQTRSIAPLLVRGNTQDLEIQPL